MNKININNILLIILVSINSQLYAADSPKSFTQAKKMLGVIYKDNKKTFYCGCTYDNKKRIDLKSCGYIPRKNAKRAIRLEWEHVVPAHHFGNSRQCWREKICTKKNGKKYKGRRCCRKVDSVFRKMEGDPMNLVPAIGEVNGDRSNYKFSMIVGEKRSYGSCDVEIDFKSKTIEPRPEVRGDIARIYFYMNEKYATPISNKQMKLFNIWNTSDPIDEWEIEKKRIINEFNRELPKK